MKIIGKILSLFVVLSVFMTVIPVYAVEGTRAASNTNSLVIDNIPTTDFISGVSPYDGTVSLLSEYDAQLAGAPMGFSGFVTKVGKGTNASYAGVTIDFTSLNIPVDKIEEMTFRVYLAGGESLRVSNHGAGSWAVLATIASNTWVDYTLKKDGTGFNGSNNFTSIASFKEVSN